MNCLGGTGRNAGTTASAGIQQNLWMGNATASELEADRPFATGILAVLAEHLLLGQAALVDHGHRVPGFCSVMKNRLFARIDAGVAEGAGIAAEVHQGKAAVTLQDDLFRAGTQAVTATRARCREGAVIERPGQAGCACVCCGLSAQKASA